MYTIFWATINNNLDGYNDHIAETDSFVAAVRIANNSVIGSITEPIIMVHSGGKQRYPTYPKEYGYGIAMRNYRKRHKAHNR